MEDVSLNIFTRLGNYVEKHWPEKMTPMDVSNMLGIRFTSLESQVQDLILIVKKLEERIDKIENDLNIFKTQTIVKTRIIGESPSNMTPFASRFKPVQPATGGNGSPQ